MPTLTGYTFGGYFDTKLGTGNQYYKADGTSNKNWNKTSATTLYAKWTAKTYTVTLDGNGATSTDHTTSVTATYGSAMPTLTTAPTRTGYAFAGYYDAASGGTQYYKADKSSARTWNKTAATTLYAHWTANTYAVTLDGKRTLGRGVLSDSLCFCKSSIRFEKVLHQSGDHDIMALLNKLIISPTERHAFVNLAKK